MDGVDGVDQESRWLPISYNHIKKRKRSVDLAVAVDCVHFSPKLHTANEKGFSPPMN